ncbi:putative secreted effector protein [Erysiphe neolycopersici]|uniref:Putative secreted effector protein n=1 Tax=Erysiphe neolycopersici TaxID=212602 RepID=A0A420I5K8_9PEZI|nr:putative secreted effector protein [Erysiphe neolycopersici]
MAIHTVFLRLLVLSILILITNVLAFCKDFKQSRNYYTTTSTQEQIISKGYVCDIPNSNYTYSKDKQCSSISECPAVTSGRVNTVGSNNISLSHDDVLPLYSLIPTKTYYTPPSFLYSLSGNVTSTSSCLKAHIANGTVNDTTTAGYYSFVPTLLCIEGTLSQCEDGPVEDETPIKICAVNALDLGADGIVPNGVQKWVPTDVETARNMSENPAQSRKTVSTESGLSLEELGISSASRINYQIKSCIGLGVLLAIISL